MCGRRPRELTCGVWPLLQRHGWQPFPRGQPGWWMGRRRVCWRSSRDDQWPSEGPFQIWQLAVGPFQIWQLAVGLGSVARREAIRRRGAVVATGPKWSPVHRTRRIVRRVILPSSREAQSRVTSKRRRSQTRPTPSRHPVHSHRATSPEVRTLAQSRRSGCGAV